MSNATVQTSRIHAWAVPAANLIYEQSLRFFAPAQVLSPAQVKNLGLDKALIDPKIPKFDDNPVVPNGVKRTLMVVKGQIFAYQNGRDGAFKPGWYNLGPGPKPAVDADPSEAIFAAAKYFFDRARVTGKKAAELDVALRAPATPRVVVGTVDVPRTQITLEGMSYVFQSVDTPSFKAGWYALGPAPFDVPTG
jgi:hypothetical protein